MFEPIALAAFFSLLLVIAAVDFKARFIPDSCVIALVILGLLQHWLRQESIFGALLTALALAVSGIALSEGAKRFLKQRALGFGDIKLLFACGLWLDPEKLPLFFIAAGACGCLTGLTWVSLGYGRRFPFAPSLALALAFSMWL